MQHKELNISGSDFSVRLLTVVAYSGMTQGSFAKVIDTSPGFLSDILRGLKKPGTDFFIKLKNNFDVSLDWLISGEGSMTGHKLIDHNMIDSIDLQIAVVKAAIVDDNASAKALLKLLKQDGFNEGQLDKSYEKVLDEIAPSNHEMKLIIDLYNRNIQTNDSKAQRLNTLSAAILHYEAYKPGSRLSKLSGNSNMPIPKSNLQVNNGKHIIATQNNYFDDK